MPSWDRSPTIPDPTALTATPTITTITTATAVPNPGTSTASQKALSTENVVYNIICHLEVDLMLQGRARRQALLSQLGRVSKAWTKPVYERVYRNPYFGTADRAYRLYQSFGLTPTPVNVHGQAPLPARKNLIRKLIVGEGSSTDIEDWPTLQLVPDIIKAANNVEIIGFDGLHNVDLEAFKKALHSRKHLRELRGCGQMPEPFCFVGHFFDEVLGPCEKVTNFRLYSLISESEHAGHDKQVARSPKPLNRALERIAFNNCSINHQEMRNILSASNTSLKSLYLEYPSSLPDDDLVQLLRYVGKGLKSFSVHDFAAGLSQSQIDERSHIVEEILEVCPVLEILNFPDAIGSPKLFDSLVESKLRLWSFSCSKDVRPEHWLDAFERKGFPSPSSCRVYVKGWTEKDIRHVRVKAHEYGVNWLSRGSTLTEMCEDAIL